MQPNVVIPGSDTIQPLVEQGFFSLVAQGPTMLDWIKVMGSWLVVVSIPAALMFLIGIIYCVEQLKVIRKKEKAKYDEKMIEPAFTETAEGGSRDLTERWHKAQSLLNSANPNDWKQAILEADNMLFDILAGLGYQGDGVGEMLKRVQPGEMRTIDDAWEAHKVRNRIAHEAGMMLNHHEASQAMHRYRKVFEEFYYI